MSMKMRSNFWKGAGMFALLGLVGKVIGVLYRLPLTNLLGAEGMGLYQMIFPLYTLLLAAASGGLPAAISKYVSELNAVGDSRGARRVLRVSLVAMTVISLVLSVAIVLLRGKIAELQGNAKAAIAYVAIAPAILLSGAIACVRGYFQGMLSMLQSGVSQLIEQVTKVAAGLTFAAVFMDMGVEYGVFGALLGVSVSEAAALVYLAVRYAFATRSSRMPALALEAAADVAAEAQVGGQTGFFAVLKRVYGVAIPITIGSLVMPLSQAVDSFMVINLLARSGAETDVATSLYGLFNGPVGSLIAMPTVVSVALASSILPGIAFSRTKDEPWDGADRSVRLVAAFMLPCAAVFLIAPTPILALLYSGGLSETEIGISSALLRIEGVNVLLLGLVQISSAMLQGVGKARVPVVNLLVGALMKIVATLVLVPLLGIYGAAVANVVCYGVTCALDVICARKFCDIHINFVKQAKILLCFAIFVAVMSLEPLVAGFTNGLVALALVSATALGAYAVALVKTKSILLSEILS